MCSSRRDKEPYKDHLMQINLEILIKLLISLKLITNFIICLVYVIEPHTHNIHLEMNTTKIDLYTKVCVCVTFVPK